MNAQERMELAALDRRLRRIEQVLAALPARFAGGGVPTVLQVEVIGGNTLSSGTQGIKSVAAKTSVSTQYDPATATSMEDGIGYGYLIANGIRGDKVLIVNDGSGVSSNAFPLIVGDVFFSSGTRSIPVGGGPGAIAPYSVG